LQRRKLLVALAVSAVVVAVGLFVLWPRTDRITRENYERIKEGMSRAEVESLLGAPGDYRTGPVGYQTAEYKAAVGRPPSISLRGTKPALWLGDHALVEVAFGQDGRALDSESGFYQGVKLAQDPLDNLLWRAERLWRRWFPE
jgi:hypothetical protein